MAIIRKPETVLYNYEARYYDPRTRDSLSRNGGKENRMRAIADNGVTHHYIYDAAGEHVIKSTGDGQTIYINGFPMGGSGTVGTKNL